MTLAASFHSLALLLSFCVGADPAAGPQWIWSPENVKDQAPEGACYFRQVFDIVEPEAGRIEIGADNKYELFVNNRRVGEGAGWQELRAYDLTGHLTAGKNVVAIMAVNEGGPAGCVARLTIKSKASKAVDLSTNDAWKTSLKVVPGWRGAEFDDSEWKVAHVIGPLGKTAPWGEKFTVVEAPVTPVFDLPPRPAGPFQLLDGDRVVFVGDTLIERAQSNDLIETRLTARYPERQILFRNLGWSGDTVFGDARAGFDTANEGYQRLKSQVFGLRPTVIIVGYGGASAFDGPAGVARFRDGLNRLLAMLGETQAQIVLLAPLPQEDLGPPLPPPGPQNQNVALYRDVIREAAAVKDAPFVDLFEKLGPGRFSPPHALTDNGIHLTPYGYWRAAQVIEEGLSLTPAGPAWDVTVALADKKLEGAGTELTAAEFRPNSVAFTAQDKLLPPPTPERAPAGAQWAGAARTLKVAGLPAGKFTLSIDEEPVATATAEEWAKGVTLAQGPEFAQVEALRKKIVAKNRLYFYRWRPQNETYLFGFRKHEQGQNAREVPEFDTLVEEAEVDIAKLRQPQPHRYDLRPAE